MKRPKLKRLSDNQRRRVARVFRHVCIGCGVKFESGSNTAKRCHPKCGNDKITEYDRTVLDAFDEICKKYLLSPRMTFMFLIGCKANRYFDFLHRRSSIGTETIVRMTAILRKWIDDIREGWYDFEQVPRIAGKLHVLSWTSTIERRAVPREKFCPRKIPSCQGGIYPGDCPRGYRQCEIFKPVDYREKNWVKYEIRRGTVRDLDGFRAKDKRLSKPRLVSDRRNRGDEGKNLRSGDILASGNGTGQTAEQERQQAE